MRFSSGTVLKTVSVEPGATNCCIKPDTYRAFSCNACNNTNDHQQARPCAVASRGTECCAEPVAAVANSAASNCNRQNQTRPRSLAGNFNCTCAAGSPSWHAQLATADDSSLHAQPALPAAIARANQHQVEISASDGDDLLAGCDHAIIRRREPHAIVLNRIPARVMCEASG